MDKCFKDALFANTDKKERRGYPIATYILTA